MIPAATIIVTAAVSSAATYTFMSQTTESQEKSQEINTKSEDNTENPPLCQIMARREDDFDNLLNDIKKNNHNLKTVKNKHTDAKEPSLLDEIKTGRKNLKPTIIESYEPDSDFLRNIVDTKNRLNKVEPPTERSLEQALGLKNQEPLMSAMVSRIPVMIESQNEEDDSEFLSDYYSDTN